MKVGYHATDKTRVPSIRRRGLIPRDTGKWNHPAYAKNEKAVYLFTNVDEANKFLNACADWADRELVLIKIDLTGIKLKPDPSFCTLKSSVKTYQRIPASAVLS